MSMLYGALQNHRRTNYIEPELPLLRRRRNFTRPNGCDGNTTFQPAGSPVFQHFDLQQDAALP